MLLTTNPTINRVRSRFVQESNGDKVTPREGEAYVPFSVFDNPNISFRQTYEAALNKIRDQATKERLLYGNWDFSTVAPTLEICRERRDEWLKRKGR